MQPLLGLLEAVEFEAERRRVSRRSLLATIGVTEDRFNALVGDRDEPTAEERRKFCALIPVDEYRLFRGGASCFGRGKATKVVREMRGR